MWGGKGKRHARNSLQLGWGVGKYINKIIKGTKTPFLGPFRDRKLAKRFQFWLFPLLIAAPHAAVHVTLKQGHPKSLVWRPLQKAGTILGTRGMATAIIFTPKIKKSKAIRY